MRHLKHIGHHSNQTSWYETLADVVMIEPGRDRTVDPDNLQIAPDKYRERVKSWFNLQS